MKKALLTKDEIARLLSPSEPLSTRSVERYIQLASVTPAVKGSGRGKQAKYNREDAEKIKAAYDGAAERREQRESTALTTTKPAMLQPVAVVAELTRSLQSSLDVWPIWLAKTEAIERTGLPAIWFDAGVASGELPHVGEGRGRRFHREDVRAFAERIRDTEYLARLLKRNPKK